MIHECWIVGMSLLFLLLFCLQMLALKYQNMSATNSSFCVDNNFVLFEKF